MQQINYSAYKALAPRTYGFGAHFIKLRLSAVEAERFELKIKDMSMIKAHVVHKDKAYVHYLYIGSNNSVGYMNILNTLQVLKKDRQRSALAKRIDSHIAKAEALAFKAEMLDYQGPPQDLWEL
jgi:hypothetical protein